MSGSWTQAQLLGAMTAASLLFVLQIALSVALVAVSTLSRVGLHRLSSEGGAKLAFLEGMREPPYGRDACGHTIQLEPTPGGGSEHLLAQRI